MKTYNQLITEISKARLLNQPQKKTTSAIVPSKGGAIVRTSQSGPSREAIGKSTADNAARKRVINNPQGQKEYDKTGTSNSAQKKDDRGLYQKMKDAPGYAARRASVAARRAVGRNVRKVGKSIAKNTEGLGKDTKNALGAANKGRKKFGQFYRRQMGAAKAQVGTPETMEGGATTGSGTRIDRG